MLAAILFLAACNGIEGPRAYEDATQVLERVAISSKQAGVAQWELEAARAVLLEDRSKMVLDTVLASIYEKGRPSAKIRAVSGEMDTATKDVTLSTHVVVTSLGEGSTLKTELLLYLPREGRIRTGAPFELDRADALILGEGIEATPDLSEIKILKQKTVLRK